MVVDRPGSSFEEREVVDLYLYRPPYAEAALEKLIELSPSDDSMLDIGCGPGKVSRPLTRYFRNVAAVDPSRNMIALGQSLPAGRAPNLRWINDLAEDASFGDSRFDMMVAAASIHWMDHDRLFAKLARHAKPRHIFAAMSGDTPFQAPWQAKWEEFLSKWVPEITGVPFGDARQQEIWAGYERHLDIEGSEYFEGAPFTQSVDDFIKCQHSRDTFTYSRLGERREAFDVELERILRGYAIGGQLTFAVRTQVTWGRIRAMPPAEHPLLG